jgi:hypothetical protein
MRQRAWESQITIVSLTIVPAACAIVGGQHMSRKLRISLHEQQSIAQVQSHYLPPASLFSIPHCSLSVNAAVNYLLTNRIDSSDWIQFSS